MQVSNDYTYLAYSDDGDSWTPVSNSTAFQGSVPDMVKRGDTLYIYTPDPDKVTRYNITTGTMDSKNIVITQSDGSTDDLGDVSPYLDPETNKIVLFYKSTKGYSGDPQFCTTCPERSATEVDGSDGVQFLTDSGDRLSTSVQQKFGDADIFYDGSKYILYIGENASTQGEKSKTFVYTSTTLKGTYTAVSTLPSGVLTESGSVPQGYYDSATGKYWTYITVLSPTSPAVIKRAVHSDFSRQLTDADFTTVLSGSTFLGLGTSYTVEGPGLVSKSYTLTVSKSGTGSGTVTNSDSNINCGSVCSYSYTSGTEITLTATADSGSSFTGWSGCSSTSGNTCTVTMNADTTVTATFTKTPNITLTLTPPSSTSVSKGSKLGPFSILLTNNTSSSYTFYAYIYLYTPDGNWRTLVSKSLTLSGSQTLSANNLYMNIPSAAPAGTYSYYVNIYDTGYNLLDQEGFGFNVVSSYSKFGGNHDWSVSGWTNK